MTSMAISQTFFDRLRAAALKQKQTTPPEQWALYQEAFRQWQTIRAYNAGVMSDYITKRLELKKHSIRIRAKMLVLG